MLHIKATVLLDTLKAIETRAGKAALDKIISNHRIMGFVILGFFRKALEISGAKRVDVHFTVPIEAGEKFCELALSLYPGIKPIRG